MSSTGINTSNPKSLNSRTYSCLSIDNEDVDNLDIEQLSKEMNDRAKEATPFTSQEIDEIIMSFENVMPDKDNSGIPLDQLRKLIEAVGHLPHKDWDKTGQSAEQLNDILLGGSMGGLSEEFKQIFKRVIEEGNWNKAAEYAAVEGNDNDNGNGKGNGKPWAILVTGVNGIRKTTSVYQPWFQQLLDEALVHPKNVSADSEIDRDSLPLEKTLPSVNSIT